MGHRIKRTSTPPQNFYYRALLTAIVAGLLLASIAAPAANAEYKQVSSWPTVMYPAGIAISSDNHIYVSDLANNRIVGYDSTGRTDFASSPDFYKVGALDIDSNGSFYIVDKKKHQPTNVSGRVTKARVSPDGTGLQIVDEVYAGEISPDGTNPLSRLRGLAAGPDGYIYVSGDLENSSVSEFCVLRLDSTLTYRPDWRPNDCDFDNAPYLYVDRSSSVHTVDPSTGQVSKFSDDGRLETAYGYGLLGYPTGIAVDSSSNVLVSDLFYNRVYKFDRFGTSPEWFSTGRQTDPPTEGPVDIAIDSSDNIYLAYVEASMVNSRILKYREDKPPGPSDDDSSQNDAGGHSSEATTPTKETATASGTARISKLRVRLGMLRFSLSSSSKIAVSIERRVRGYRVKRRCKPASKLGRQSKSCWFYRNLNRGSFYLDGRAGSNSVRLSKKLQNELTKHSHDRFRVTAVAIDTNGKPGHSARRLFKLKGGRR